MTRAYTWKARAEGPHELRASLVRGSHHAVLRAIRGRVLLRRGGGLGLR